ncbi:MAG: peptidoglycan-binding protein [Actinomycetes bacterium]
MMPMHAHQSNLTTLNPRKTGSRRLAAALLLAVICVLCAAPQDASARAMRRGDHGPRVKTLQRLLHIHADGIFGEGTVRAVRGYQRTHGLPVDGLAGNDTVWALRRSNRKRAHTRSRTRTAASAYSGSRVKAIQRRLHIGADGVFGPGTAAAVKRFQRSRGLTADGIVGQGTWSAMGFNGFRKPALRRKPGRSSSPAPQLGNAPAIIRAMIAAGNRIAHKPYVYGGGHGSFNASGYDCSGSVSYVLHGGGLLSSPLDSSGLMSWGRPGPGRWVTIYANGGHTFMRIGNRRFDTSGASQSGTRWSREMRSGSGYVVRHPAGL